MSTTLTLTPLDDRGRPAQVDDVQRQHGEHDHVNADTTDNRIQNTIPLCRDCHQRATFPGI